MKQQPQHCCCSRSCAQLFGGCCCSPIPHCPLPAAQVCFDLVAAAQITVVANLVLYVPVSMLACQH
jgi:hypothetical protein